MHIGALYKFNGSTGAANTAFQADIGGQFQGASIDAYYSKVNDAISASSLSAAQVADLPKLGYSASNSVAATISDNTTFAVMALYNSTRSSSMPATSTSNMPIPTKPLERWIHRHRRLHPGVRVQQRL